MMNETVSSLLRRHFALWSVIVYVMGALLCTAGYADRSDYNRAINILVENKSLSVLHHHDWSYDATKRRKIMSSWQGAFQPDNLYAYVECIDQFSGQVLFKAPSPPLTFLWISNDSRYVVGLSKIKLDNPIQLIILDRKGHLIKKRAIASWEVELTRNEYARFVHQFPSAAHSLISGDRIVAFNDKIFVDPYVSGDAWEFLSKKMTRSHFSSNFSESSSNYIFWYKEDGPDIRLLYDDENLVGLSLLDPKGQRFEIPIVEQFIRR